MLRSIVRAPRLGLLSSFVCWQLRSLAIAWASWQLDCQLTAGMLIHTLANLFFAAGLGRLGATRRAGLIGSRRRLSSLGEVGWNPWVRPGELLGTPMLTDPAR